MKRDPRYRSLALWLAASRLRWRRSNSGLFILAILLSCFSLAANCMSVWVFMSYQTGQPLPLSKPIADAVYFWNSYLVWPTLMMAILLSLLELGTWQIADEMHGAFKPGEVYGAMLWNARHTSYWLVFGLILLPLITYQLRNDIGMYLLPRWVVYIRELQYSTFNYVFDTVLLQVLLLAYIAEALTLVALRLPNRSLWLRLIAFAALLAAVPIVHDCAHTLASSTMFALPDLAVILIGNLYMVIPLFVLIVFNSVRTASFTESMLSSQVLAR